MSIYYIVYSKLNSIIVYRPVASAPGRSGACDAANRQ